MITNRQILGIIETKADYLRKMSCNRKLAELWDVMSDKDKKEEMLKQYRIICAEYEQWLDTEAL